MELGAVTTVRASDGAQLAVHGRAGPGPTVLLVHGFTLDHRCWEAVSESLVLGGVSVVAVDLRGHGASTLGTDPPDLVRLTQDLGEVVRTLGSDRVVAVGHSLGAFVTLGARADAELASCLDGIVAISAMATSITNPFVKAGARFFTSHAGARLVRSPRLGRSMLHSWFRHGASDTEVEATRAWSASCPVAGRRAVGGATDAIDLRPGFATPGPRTLIACGADDRATPPDHSRRIAAAIPGANLHIVDGAGHMVITEQAVALGTMLAEWITGRSST